MRMCERAQYILITRIMCMYVCMSCMFVHVPVCHVCMSCILQFVWWCTRVTTVHTCGEVRGTVVHLYRRYYCTVEVLVRYRVLQLNVIFLIWAKRVNINTIFA